MAKPLNKMCERTVAPRAVAAVAAITVAVITVAGGGCAASLSHTVDSDTLRDMSRQGQLWVYDAENEIVVALDQLDEAKDELAASKRRIKDARRGIESAEKRSKRGAVDVAEAWLVHLEAMEDYVRAMIKLRRFGIVVARAAVELAKAQVIQREDLLGGKDFNVHAFQEQYNQLKKRFDRRQKRVQKDRRAARKKEQRWWGMRRRYIAQSGDHDTGLWIE